MTDGWTKIDAPMMMPTTRAVACSAVIERDNMARKPARASDGLPEANPSVSPPGRENVAFRGRCGAIPCASNHRTRKQTAGHGRVTHDSRVSCALQAATAWTNGRLACAVLFSWAQCLIAVGLFFFAIGPPQE